MVLIQNIHSLYLSSQLGNCVEIGLPMLFLVIGLSQVSGHLNDSSIKSLKYSQTFKKVTALLPLQYLKHVKPLRDFPICERFPVLISVSIIWIYSLILTASGAYRGKPNATQISCRTDRAGLITSAPWLCFLSSFLKK